jgi:hypothetical protein
MVWMGLARYGGGAAVAQTQSKSFQLSFDGRLKVNFQGSSVTSDGGLLLGRELREWLGFGALIKRHLADARDTAERAAEIAKVILIAKPSASAICK